MPRSYNQTRRARQTEERRVQILHAVGRLMLQGAYDDMTLKAVAREAGVSLKTVTRHFGTKEELLRAAMELATEHEEQARRVPRGDVAAVVSALAGRYEESAELIYRMGDMELKHDWLSDWIQAARESHMRWLADAFQPWLHDQDEQERSRRLACLFVATEVRSWWALRSRLGLDRAGAEDVLRASLDALVLAWSSPAPAAGD